MSETTSGFAESWCKGCGKRIIWAFNPETKKRVPLDARATIYEVTELDESGTPLVRTVENHFVSHFHTCRDANKFSRGHLRIPVTTEVPTCPLCKNVLETDGTCEVCGAT